MFKLGSFEEEIAKSMQEKLVSNQMEKKYSFDRITKAVDFLNEAASIFDDTGFNAEAEVLTRMIERLAQKQPVKKVAHELDPSDMELLHGLAPHHQAKLSKLDKKELLDELRKIKLQRMIGEELGKGVGKTPEVLEFESIMGQGHNLPKSDRLDDIVEFDEDIFAADDKKKV